MRRMLADGGLHPARMLQVMFSSVWVRPGVTELRVPAAFPPKVACRGWLAARPPGGAWVADGKKPTVLHRDLPVVIWFLDPVLSVRVPWDSIR